MSTGIITDNDVNLREDASKLKEPKGQLSKGMFVTIVANLGKWLQVRTPIGDGFVSAEFVKIQPDTASGNGTQPTEDSSQPETSRTTTEITATNVRFPAATTEIPDQSKLQSYIDNITSTYTIPQGYYDFWAQRQILGLPEPFEVSPVHLNDPGSLQVNGFGPNSFALNNWMKWYKNVCGMHNGFDYNIATGTPLVALSDALVVGNKNSWQFMPSPYEMTLVLWCLLPESVTGPNRMLSNVLIAYGHMSNNKVVKKNEIVKAGQVIGYSGFPRFSDGSTQPDNPHLHMEIHLLSGDNQTPFPRKRQKGLLRAYDRDQPLDNNTPFNPILFFSERLVKYHLNQSEVRGRKYPDMTALNAQRLSWPGLDFFTMGYYQYPGRENANVIWNSKTLPWPNGIYNMATMNQRIANFVPFVPYPLSDVKV